MVVPKFKLFNLLGLIANLEELAMSTNFYKKKLGYMLLCSEDKAGKFVNKHHWLLLFLYESYYYKAQFLSNKHATYDFDFKF